MIVIDSNVSSQIHDIRVNELIIWLQQKQQEYPTYDLYISTEISNKWYGEDRFELQGYEKI